MARTINKYTNTGYAISVVVKIGLNGDVLCWRVLSMIGKPQPVLIEEIKEDPFKNSMLGREVQPVGRRMHRNSRDLSSVRRRHGTVSKGNPAPSVG